MNTQDPYYYYMFRKLRNNFEYWLVMGPIGTVVGNFQRKVSRRIFLEAGFPMDDGQELQDTRKPD